ncbi:MAG TPA: tRNA (adenosine(37)-N6)-threonylcarbamoyltransferase complex dimerization subunit type 1 TsaB, partial [Terriglobales bacterium]|nr:tRNA (adenosine(37)-N6)-threonylcarbamoyltransferase complex dimerization subunit type 1 TsaB [Terriglobales bacterium]
MLVLAVDTSGRNGSMALARCSEPDTCEFLEVVDLAGGTFSAQLIPQISALLSQHKLTKTDIDAFAVASGPGSFTGLRIGLAAIKALGEILAKPIAAVSVLEVVAVSGALSTKCLAATDAGRTDVYAAEYDERLGTERLLTMPEFLLSAK